MAIGALYFALFCSLLIVWAQTNKPDQPLNLWRLYLVQLASIGALASTHSPPVVYVVVGGVLAIFVTAHFVGSHILRTEFSHHLYRVATFGSAVVWYALTAFLMQQPHGFRPVAPLIVLVPTIVCTYTKFGQRVWSWTEDTLTGNYR